jgi:hypothetical protein
MQMVLRSYTLHLWYTAIVQFFLLFLKFTENPSFSVIASWYYYSFISANLLLAFDHVIRTQIKDNSIKSVKSKFSTILINIVINLNPFFAVQYLRQIGIRYGQENKVPYTNMLIIFISNIMIAAILIILFWRQENILFLIIGFLIFGLILIYTIRSVFGDVTLTNYSQIKFSHLNQISVDITLLVAPALLLWVSALTTSGNIYELTLSLIICSSAVGVFSGVIQSLSIRQLEINKMITISTYIVVSLITLILCQVYLENNKFLWCFVYAYIILGLYQSNFIHYLRISENIKLRRNYLLSWLVTLSLFCITSVTFHESAIPFCVSVTIGYFINVYYSRKAKI